MLPASRPPPAADHNEEEPLGEDNLPDRRLAHHDVRARDLRREPRLSRRGKGQAEECGLHHPAAAFSSGCRAVRPQLSPPPEAASAYRKCTPMNSSNYCATSLPYS